MNSVFLWECGCVNAAEEAGAYAALALGFAGAELFRVCREECSVSRIQILQWKLNRLFAHIHMHS